MLKGETTIELTDVHTGEKEEIKSENMFTNGLKYLIDNAMRLDMGLFNIESHRNFCFPVLGNLLGGVMLFDSELEEDSDNINPPSLDDGISCTGYANNYMNNTLDIKRGSINKTESGEIENGYRFVWDFNTAQSNGRIASVALTTKTGGACGSNPNRYAGLRMSAESDTTSLDNMDAGHKFWLCNESQYTFDASAVNVTGTDIDVIFNNSDIENILSFDPGRFSFQAYKTVFSDGKFKLFLFDMCLNISNISLKEAPLTIGHIKNCRSCVICDSGGAFGSDVSVVTMVTTTADEPDMCYLIKVMETSKLALAKVNMKTMALMYCKNVDITPHKIEGNYKIYTSAAVKNRTLYLPGYKSISKLDTLKINTDNTSEISIIAGIEQPEKYTQTPYKRRCIYQGKRIIFPGMVLDGDNISLSLTKGHSSSSNFISGGIIDGSIFYTVYTWSNIIYLDIGIVSNFMATINNLPSPVVKTADKTMKITYIVRDIEETV
ncbi:hypothetical protein NE619_09750 [Anaerovorax odorimutans]|uniref:Uncharacterized protein n=1 Tax=Anaerovorax odorimutans TaxID=109327 RepID=A0ABT1RPC0_9FIRM|nr:hypothetical protein [Anaerovorax odorimutans]MCQ4637014.1 hypothetical protein [Anaerovorax odorimutans]